MPDQALAQPTRTRFRSGDGTSPSVFDYDGAGQLTLFLHGLAGHAGEWTDVAARITTETRKVAFDQRGHGQSMRRPPGVARADSVANVVVVIRRFRLTTPDCRHG